MSPFQQAQMFSLQDANIHNIAIDGVFDDCQDIVKAVSNDLAFKRRHRIGTVNSINWARLLAQVVYYFAGYFQATTANDEPVSFAVPSGNFGNICAGHVARMMGLPIRRLVLATNENDVLDEFFRTGTYRVRSSAETHETSSPSMDIRKARNFERFVFDLLGRDARAHARSCSATELDARRRLHARRADEFARVAGFGFVSGTQHPRRPRSRRSATPGSATASMIDTAHRRRPEGRARAPRARRADDRARDRAAGQVRRDHRRGAGHASPSRRPALRGIESLPQALHRSAGRRGSGQGLHRRRHVA